MRVATKPTNNNFNLNNLNKMIKDEPRISEFKNGRNIPDGYWVDYVSATFVETIRWWIANGMKESPEEIHSYFLLAING